MAKIKFLNLQITEINLKADTYDQNSTDKILSNRFKVNCLMGEPQDRTFAIGFELLIGNETKDFSLDVKAIAHFETDEDITDEFRTSDFVFVNAPAIAFPFLRAFISTITLNSGYNPIVLPAFNFVALAKEIKDRSALLAKNEKKIPAKKASKP